MDKKIAAEQGPIDVVLYWVDGQDPEWLAQKRAHLPNEEKYASSTAAARFRSWDNLEYIFRGIELYMPWVRTIHFVTWGHLPSWLNKEHPKLHVVRHTDYIPEVYLPTFNSHTIELNLYRIEGLSERFIVFNDDMFVIGPTRVEDFFVNGLPRDMAALSPYNVQPGGIAAIVMNNLEVIQKYFSLADVKKHWRKWLSPSYGKHLLKTMVLSQFSFIVGLYEPHVPIAFQKSTFETLWEKEPELLHQTSLSKFREKHNVNIWLMRDWQLMTGQFKPRPANFSLYRTLPHGLTDILQALSQPRKIRLLCINDSLKVTQVEDLKKKVNDALEQRFPEKSSFER